MPLLFYGIHICQDNKLNTLTKIESYSFFKKLDIYLFIYFLAALGLRCCVPAFSSCGEQELLFVAVRGLLWLRSTGSRRTGFSSCSTWAQ